MNFSDELFELWFTKFANANFGPIDDAALLTVKTLARAGFNAGVGANSINKTIPVFLVGLTHDDGARPWEFVGVFDLRDAAIAACTSPGHFVGPFLMNGEYEGVPTPWPNAFYPLASEAKV